MRYLLFGILWTMTSCVDDPCADRVDYSSIDRNNHLSIEELYGHIDSLILQEVRDSVVSVNLNIDEVDIVFSYTHPTGRKADVMRFTARDQVHFGYLVHPKEPELPEKNALLVFLPGLDQRNPKVEVDPHYYFTNIFQDLPHHFIFIPSFRGQALLCNLKSFCSDGYFGDAYFGAAVDAARAINHLHEFLSNNEDIALQLYGISRGATVGLILTSLLDGVDLLIAQSGPYNFYKSSLLQKYGRQYRYQFLSQKSNLYSIRKGILMSSPVYYLPDSIPNSLFIHGKHDRVVDLFQFRDLQSRLVDQPSAVFLLRDGGHMLDEWDHVKEILLQH